MSEQYALQFTQTTTVDENHTHDPFEQSKIIMKNWFKSYKKNAATDIARWVSKIFSNPDIFNWDTGQSSIIEIPNKFLGNGNRVFRHSSIRSCMKHKIYYANGAVMLYTPLDGVQPHNHMRPGNRVHAIEFVGYCLNENIKRGVPAGMRKKMISSGIPAICAVTGSSHVEIDHKEGRLKNGAFQDGNDPNLYQFLTRANNQVKREACKKCVATNKRFDATKIGFNQPVTSGTRDYTRDQGCVGCYWHDVRDFHNKATR